MSPVSETGTGVGLLTEPVLRLPLDTAVTELGVTVLRLLRESRVGVAMPRSQSEAMKPLLKAAGVRSWREFATATYCCDVAAVGDALHFVPSIGRRPGNPWFEPKPADELTIERGARPEEIGSTLVTALKRCELL